MAFKLFYLLFRRLRVILGAVGFILMYGLYNHILTLPLLLVGLGFGFLDLFGGTYNDYQDYEQDIKNKRKDKWIVNGLVTRRQMKYISFLSLSLALILLTPTNFLILGIGVYYSILMWGYSYPKIPLKRNIITYTLLSSIYLLLPYSLSILINKEFSLSDLFFTTFFFFQTLYLLCQKDSTDLKDETNIFLKYRWGTSLLFCIFFSVSSLIAMFFLSINNLLLLVIFGMSFFLKFYLLSKIYRRKITQQYRSKIILFEFLTPYFYALGAL